MEMAPKRLCDKVVVLTLATRRLSKWLVWVKTGLAVFGLWVRFFRELTFAIPRSGCHSLID
jgi:hypothetical protein